MNRLEKLCRHTAIKQISRLAEQLGRPGEDPPFQFNCHTITPLSGVRFQIAACGSSRQQSRHSLATVHWLSRDPGAKLLSMQVDVF